MYEKGGVPFPIIQTTVQGICMHSHRTASGEQLKREGAEAITRPLLNRCIRLQIYRLAADSDFGIRNFIFSQIIGVLQICIFTRKAGQVQVSISQLSNKSLLSCIFEMAPNLTTTELLQS